MTHGQVCDKRGRVACPDGRSKKLQKMQSAPKRIATPKKILIETKKVDSEQVMIYDHVLQMAPLT